jgi:predicted secreted hydrolase
VPPVSFPRDEAPHDLLTEWWYYTGHLAADDGAVYGFESVIFQSLRGDFPPYYAAHVAITDHARAAFRYDQRAGAAAVGAGPGFDLRLGDWAWRGHEGRDRLEARLPDYAFALDLVATKPPALHNAGPGGVDGYVDFGPAGGSYYYSRTRMELRGTLDDHGVRKAVVGAAWFDHQWGNFVGLNTGGGGWDWFSAQLADGSDFTLSLLTDADRRLVGAYGTYVAADGRDTFIAAADLHVEVLDRWTSPRTGFTYPARWRVTLPRQGLTLVCTPVLNDQELDTRASTGNVYWEGQVRYEGTRDGAPIAGAGYIELTGYDRP